MLELFDFYGNLLYISSKIYLNQYRKKEDDNINNNENNDNDGNNDSNDNNNNSNSNNGNGDKNDKNNFNIRSNKITNSPFQLCNFHWNTTFITCCCMLLRTGLRPFQ